MILRLWRPHVLAWWVAQAFLFGSTAWGINAIAIMLRPPKDRLAVWSALAGGTLFEIGGILQFVDELAKAAPYELRVYALRHLKPTAHTGSAMTVAASQLVPPFAVAESPTSRIEADQLAWGDVPEDERDDIRKLSEQRWYYRVMLVATAIQLVGATVFWMSTIAGLPPVLTKLNASQQNAIYWLPQVVGGFGFVVASVLFIVDAAPDHHSARSILTPHVCSLAWHVGIWNLLGAIGFMLSGVFGLYASVGKYQYWGTAFNSAYGSVSFLIGSAAQLLAES